MKVTKEFLIAAAAEGRMLRGLHIEGMGLQSVKLDGLQLENCCLDRADLSGASLRGATFKNVRASQAVFNRANLNSCTFENVAARGSFLQDASMVGMEWTGGNLQQAFVLSANARHSRWTDVDIAGAVWVGTSLAFADIRRLPNGRDIARWFACGTGAPEHRAALALFNSNLNTMRRAEAREGAEAWLRMVTAIRSGCSTEAEANSLIRREITAIYDGSSHDSLQAP